MRRRRALRYLLLAPLLASGAAWRPGISLAQAQGRCDASGLSKQERQERDALEYVDRSPHPRQTCGNCMHLQPTPAKNGGPCKACSVLPGPVHMEGWCTAWVARIGGAG